MYRCLKVALAIYVPKLHEINYPKSPSCANILSSTCRACNAGSVTGPVSAYMSFLLANERRTTSILAHSPILANKRLTTL